MHDAGCGDYGEIKSTQLPALKTQLARRLKRRAIAIADTEVSPQPHPRFLFISLQEKETDRELGIVVVHPRRMK